MLILSNAPVPDEQAAQLRALSPKIELMSFPKGTMFPKDALSRAEIVYTESGRFERADAPKLRWMQTDSAATQPVRGSPIMRTDIPVANASGAYSVPVAECAIGMLLAVTRKITKGVRYQLQSKWEDGDYEPWCGVDIQGMTMGIVGYGSIGREIARIARAMGMNILACKRDPKKRDDLMTYTFPGTGDPHGQIPAGWYGIDRVTEMLQKSDVVMVTLPHTPETEHLLGERELKAIPRHAFFANVGRGAVVDEAALARKLQAGELAGAALDVTEVEPLSAESPLWKMENVLIMPHIASYTAAQAKRAATCFIENVRRDLAGEPLLNIVDKKLLY
jgi:phosphoglycerate dehydrogenase-like enzyme